ncbi:protein CWC15, partial [Phenoliferia sp. Uapishka_3]
MSSAHRPTWEPAQGKDSRGASRIYSSRDIAAHTRLKFRQPGQGTANEVARRDLKLELMAAERESNSRKSRGQPGYAADGVTNAGLIEAGAAAEVEDDAGAKRRKVLADVGGLDADDDDEEPDEGTGDNAHMKEGKGKGRAVSAEVEGAESEEESSDDDDEDETAELLRELEKIKRERAEEREKNEREKAATEQTSREEEIATGNPLLNLQSALGYSASPTPSMMSSSTSSSFGVKRRWDDDVIFKNQARGTSETPKKEFVLMLYSFLSFGLQNDLLRTKFHQRFMKKFIG